jgi:H+/Cl- antiporter ClcA
MSDQIPESAENSAVVRWPTGITTLFGLLAGAFAGIATNLIPLGMVTGLAFGAGIDSILNRLLNTIPNDESPE